MRSETKYDYRQQVTARGKSIQTETNYGGIDFGAGAEKRYIDKKNGNCISI